MEIIKVLLLIVEAVTSILLVGVILLQRSKNEGLGLAFGSGVGESLFGSRAGNVLTKITITLAIIFMATTTLLGVVFSNYHEKSIIDSRAPAMPVQQAMPAPQSAAQPGPAGIAPETAQPSGPASTLLPGTRFDDQPAPAPQPTPVQEQPTEKPAESQP